MRLLEVVENDRVNLFLVVSETKTKYIGYFVNNMTSSIATDVISTKCGIQCSLPKRSTEITFISVGALEDAFFRFGETLLRVLQEVHANYDIESSKIIKNIEYQPTTLKNHKAIKYTIVEYSLEVYGFKIHIYDYDDNHKISFTAGDAPVLYNNIYGTGEILKENLFIWGDIV